MDNKRVHLIVGDSVEPVLCKQIDIADFPQKGDILGGWRIIDIREIFVDVNEGDYRYQKPWDWETWGEYTFFECDLVPLYEQINTTCKKYYFCLLYAYAVVCQLRDYAPEHIEDIYHIPTPAELRDKYSHYLSCDEDSIQVIHTGTNEILSEYCPAKHR